MVPPTVSPYASNRHLGPGAVGTPSSSFRGSGHLSPFSGGASNKAGSARDVRDKAGFVNKGWSMLQDVFTSSSSPSNLQEGRQNRSVGTFASELPSRNFSRNSCKSAEQKQIP